MKRGTMIVGAAFCLGLLVAGLFVTYGMAAGNDIPPGVGADQWIRLSEDAGFALHATYYFKQGGLKAGSAYATLMVRRNGRWAAVPIGTEEGLVIPAR